jgi:MFS family permease
MSTKATTPTARAADTAAAAWVILAALLLFSIAAPLNQFKVPPIMPVLMEQLGVTVSAAGLLMSVYAITGLILALPAGLIFQKAGLKVTGLLAGGSIILGAIMGALSQSFNGLLISRVIEGAGTSFMAVLAPAVIAQWFAAHRRGTAMGIWSAWVPVGSAAMLILAPVLVNASGWRAVWWFGAIYALAVTALYLVVVRPAPGTSAHAPASNATGGERSGASAMRNGNIWLLAAAFGAFNAAVIGLSTFLPTFLNAERGMSLGQAALVGSLATLITIFSAPAGGVISDRIGSRKRPYLVGFAAAIVLLPLTGVLPVALLIALMIVNGLAMGLIPTNIFAAAVEATGDPSQGGAAMAVVMVGQNAGMLVGPVIVGALAQSAGWPLAFAATGVMAAVGLGAGWLAKVR